MCLIEKERERKTELKEFLDNWNWVIFCNGFFGFILDALIVQSFLAKEVKD